MTAGEGFVDSFGGVWEAAKKELADRGGVSLAFQSSYVDMDTIQTYNEGERGGGQHETDGDSTTPHNPHGPCTQRLIGATCFYKV